MAIFSPDPAKWRPPTNRSGRLGDCMRVCVAGLLGCADATDVPVFRERDLAALHARYDRWLRRERGLRLVEIPVPGSAEWSVSMVLAHIARDGPGWWSGGPPGVFALAGGVADRAGNHCVLARSTPGRVEVWDPFTRSTKETILTSGTFTLDERRSAYVAIWLETRAPGRWFWSLVRALSERFGRGR